MTSTVQPDWAVIRCRYETTDDAVATICADADIPRAALDARRKKEAWRRQNPRAFPPPRRPTGVPKPAARQPAKAASAPAPVPTPATPSGSGRAAARRLPATPAARRRLLDRLVAAISLKLSQLERRMSTDLDASDDTTATDHERETRAIGALIDNLEKITEMEAGLGKSSGKRGAAAVAPTDLADEADRCRRELADRLSRIVAGAGPNP